jgi:60 kDa SS-A/Ro ribonucleoprotein
MGVCHPLLLGVSGGAGRHHSRAPLTVNTTVKGAHMASKNPLSWFSTRATPQGEALVGAGQVPNSAGGFAWEVDDWSRLRRFLILGVDGPSYYASERQLVKENAQAVLRCVEVDGPRTVDEIVSVSVEGRNPKQQPVIFALAACAAAADDETRALALAALPKVCRTGTHLFLFAGYVEQFRGWGRGLRRAVGNWYLEKEPDALAYQLVKYQQRDGWSHRDLLRLAKPQPERGSATDLALAWAVGKAELDLDNGTPELLRAHRAALACETPEETAALVTASGLPWEAVRSEHLRSAVLWRAFVPTMGLGALVRNLGRLTTNGTLEPGNEMTDRVVSRMTDAGEIRRARLHPIAVLTALMTYKAGRGLRGQQRWKPIAAIVDALDEAFYLAFGNVNPAGMRTMLALDVSASMTMGAIGGVFGLSPRVASSAMAAVTLASEPSVETVAFTSTGRGQWTAPNPTGPHGWTYGISTLPLSKRQRLDDIMAAVDGLPFGATDCALPMLYALDKGRKVDHFVIYTDSETWAGEIHPSQALRQYRERTGIDARLTVVGMVSNGFSIADPRDPGMLDVVGFDSSAPQLVADFAAGRL